MALTTPSGQPSNNPSSDFQGASIPNRIGYRFKDLDPGANIYIQRDDRLVIQMVSNVVSEVANVNVRLLIPGRDAGRTQPSADTVDNPLGDNVQGEIIALNSMVKAANVSTVGTTIINLAEGYLLSIGISCTGATARGRTYVRAYLLRGSNTLTNVSYLLCGDYVTINTPTGFPFSQYRLPTEGGGWRRVQSIGAPAAGTDPSPGNSNLSRSALIAFQGVFTASAAVANRIPTIRFQDTNSGIDIGTYVATAAITAGQVVKVIAAPGILPNATIATNIFIVLPQPGYLSNPANLVDGSVQPFITTVGIQAGDQWSNLEWETEEWIDF